MSNIDANKKEGDYERGLHHVIDNLGLLFQSSEHGQWIMKAGNIVNLHEKIKQFNPKHILELGTGIGCSTAVMAFTCPEASVYTVEQNQKCIDIAKKLIPAGLQERIYFRKANPRVFIAPQVNPLVNWSSYDEFDWHDYDFILVDGPSGFHTKVQIGDKVWSTFADPPNGDIINLLPLMKEGTIIYVDGRKVSTRLYNRHLQNYLERIEGDKTYEIYRRNSVQLNSDFSNFINDDTTVK